MQRPSSNSDEIIPVTAFNARKRLGSQKIFGKESSSKRRPRTCYNFFQSARGARIRNDVAKEHPNKTRVELSDLVARQIAKEWKELTAEQREQFKQMADVEAIKFRQDLERKILEKSLSYGALHIASPRNI
jgi:hypothetical protein